jgi:type III pantothenate kinase
MSRILLLDRGNRSLKASLAESGQIEPGRRADPDRVEALIEGAGGPESLDGIAYSSVVPEWSASLSRMLSDTVIEAILEVRHDINLPFALGVDEPETLGPDRISAAAGVIAMGASEAIIIDAGTAITVDVVRGGVFEGGAIFPGSDLLAGSLDAGTAALPHVPDIATDADIPGRSTKGAIRAGLTWGLVGAIAELVRRSSWPGAEIWLTGGESDRFEQALGDGLHIERDLVLVGLLELFSLNAP